MHAAGHVICTCHDILHILCDFLEELFTENTVMSQYRTWTVGSHMSHVTTNSPCAVLF
jgi:hypothetical protein